MSNKTNKEQTIKDLVSYLENWSNDANDSRNRYEATYDYFVALQLSAHCKEKEEWVPICEYKTGIVLRWHKKLKCPITVYQAKNGKWYELTFRLWPDELFEPFFKEVPKGPC